MNPSEWERVKGIFQDALARPPQARPAYVSEACQHDERLRAEVESLLATYDEAGAFAERPVELLDALGAATDSCAYGRAVHPGDRLGVFEIQTLLGAGGMGEVYRARDTRLDRTVAIKVLPRHFAADRDRYQRFEREARAVASLDHPHIGALYDVGEHDGLQFLVMQYLDGATLAARLANSVLPPDQALRCAVEIGEALDHAHRRGIVHRDLKPGNIFLTKSGAKLLDFGLAKWRPAPSGVFGPTRTPESLTDGGTIVGTLHYMAPEQLKGKDADARSDVFAFGVVMYEMLTGRKPFDGESSAGIVAAILETQPPAISAIRPLSPPALDHVVATCLSKDPDERWQSAADVARHLRWIAQEGAPAPASVSAATSAPVRRLMLVASALASLAIGLIGGALGWSRIAAPPVVPLPVMRSVAVTANTTDTFALSRDGRQIAYTIERKGRSEIYVRSLDESDARLIAEDAHAPFFSPDGQSIGFSREDGLMKMAVRGGVPQTISAMTADFGATWGADDTIVFSPKRTSGLYRVAASGGTPTALTKLEAGEKSHRWPQLLPGSRAALFTIQTPEMTSVDAARIGVVSLDTGERRILMHGGTSPLLVATGHLLYFRGASLVAAPFDLRRLEITGQSETVLDGIAVDASGWGNFSVSDNGSMAYVPATTSDNSRFVWVDRHGSSEPLTNDARVVGSNPRVSPDGQRVALEIVGANDQIWIYDFARRTFSKLTNAWNNRWPRWTPDGKMIMFLSDRSGAWNIYRQSADGSSAAERLTESSQNQGIFSSSPDGHSLAFNQETPTGRNEIWLFTLAPQRRLQRLIQTPYSNQYPAISPDGRWIAYMSDETGQWEIYVQPFPELGAKWQVSNDGGRGPHWEPKHGRELYYKYDGRMMAVAIRTTPTFAAGAPRVLFSGPSENAGWDVAPDGRFIMVQRQSQPATPIMLVENWFEELKRKSVAR